MALPAHLVAQFQFGRLGATAGCKLYYQATAGTPDNTNMEEIADTIAAGLNPAFAACMAYPISVGPLIVRYRAGSVDLEATSENGIGVGLGVGTSSVPLDCMPEEVAAVIQRRTNLAGRSKRGRVFIPFVPESFFVDSTVSGVGLPIYKALGVKIAEVLVAGAITLTPVQPDWKNNLLHQVLHTRVVGEACSRMDRRDRGRPFYHLAI